MISARRSLLLVVIAMAVALCCSAAAAQVAIGLQPFGSFGGGPDVINLGNLNVRYTIPVRHKAGRGNNFNWDITYDSSIWTPVGAVGNQAWNPVGTWGWNGLSPAAQPYVTYQVTYNSGHCGYMGQSSYQVWNYGNFDFVDQFGGGAWFNTGISYYSSPGGSSCPPNGPQPPTVYPISANGYTMYASPGPGSVTGNVFDRSGTAFNPPFGTSPPTQPNSYTWTTDHNSNSITVNNGVFTDTMNQTALSIVLATNTTLFYTAPSGARANYVVSYKTYVVRTNFGCGQITEYNSARTLYASLVDRVTLPDGSYYQFNYETTYLDANTPHDVTGRIASVTLPSGGTISYMYTSGGTGVNEISCTDGATTTLVRTTPDTGSNFWTYAHTQVAGAHWKTSVTDPTANQTVIDFQEDTAWPGRFYETQRQVYQGSTSGTLLDTVTTCYNTNTSNCTTTAVGSPISQLNVTTQLGTSNLQSLRVSSYNANGLLTEEDDYDYAHGTPTTILKKKVITYASLGSVVNMPATVAICSPGGTSTSCNGSSGVPVAQTTYTYDQGTLTPSSGTPQHNCASNGCSGNVTTIARLVQGSNTLNSTYTYYDTGMMKTFTDVNGAVFTFNYPDANSTCGNAFPTSITEPLGNMSRSMTWNCSGGVQLTSTDENSKTTTVDFADASFWRPDYVTDPTGAKATFSYPSTSPYNWVGSTMTVISGNSVVDVLKTFDGIGRTHLRQKRQGPTSATYDTVETDYDPIGRVSRVTLAYSGTSGQSNSSAPATTETYDALNRPVVLTDGGNGTASYNYIQNDAYLSVGPVPTGENAKRRQFEYNALGHLTSVCEVTSASQSGTCGQNSAATGYLTTYTYDAIGDLTGVAQNAQPNGTAQPRSYSFDGLRRLTSETNPESGATNYTYDSANTGVCVVNNPGDLVMRTNAAGVGTCYVHDALHRLLSVGHNPAQAGNTPDRFFLYDSATVNGVGMPNAKGHLAEAYTCLTPCTKITDVGFGYSPRGEVSDVYQLTPHSSPSYYHVSQTYWPHGAPFLLSSGIAGLPSISYGGTIGSTVGLDGEGRITQVTGASGQNPVTGVTYNNSSLPTQVTFGSADTDIFAYDPNTLRTTQYQFNVNGQSSTGTLTWNANSSLQKLIVTDAFNSSDNQTCNYSHDDLSRIAQADCGSGGWGQSFTYDPFGNITKNVLANHSGNSFQPTYSSASNRFLSIPGASVSYDANGNVLTDGSHTYTWNADGNTISLDGVGLTFDAFDRMVEQNRSGAYTEIVYTPGGAKLALMSGTGGQTLQTAFIRLPGQATAVYSSSGLDHYRHSDWLDSARLTSSPTRTVLSTAAYAPFGETYAQSGTADLSFTGQNQDSVPGDYDFLHREYSTQGRWPSPDPAGLGAVNPKDPQSWNRYAYVKNNPLSFVDPFGLDCIYVFDDQICVKNGDCYSEGDNGLYVPGTVDYASIDSNGNLTYEYNYLDSNGLLTLSPGGISGFGGWDWGDHSLDNTWLGQMRDSGDLQVIISANDWVTVGAIYTGLGAATVVASPILAEGALAAAEDPATRAMGCMIANSGKAMLATGVSAFALDEVESGLTDEQKTNVEKAELWTGGALGAAACLGVGPIP